MRNPTPRKANECVRVYMQRMLIHTWHTRPYKKNIARRVDAARRIHRFGAQAETQLMAERRNSHFSVLDVNLEWWFNNLATRPRAHTNRHEKPHTQSDTNGHERMHLLRGTGLSWLISALFFSR